MRTLPVLALSLLGLAGCTPQDTTQGGIVGETTVTTSPRSRPLIPPTYSPTDLDYIPFHERLQDCLERYPADICTITE